jgi:quinol monooxygenase YgiN
LIIVSLHLKVPSAKRSEVIDIIDSYVGPVSVQPGCAGMKLFAGISNDNDLILISEWNSLTELERHILSDDFIKILTVMDLAYEQPEITFHEVSSTFGFEFVERLRA